MLNHVPQSPQAQQQISSQPFTPPPTTCQQQVGAPNVTPVNIQSTQMCQFSSQPQLYAMQENRRASLGALSYSQITPSFTHPNSALDMQLNNQYITTPPQYFGSMNLIDPVVAASMNNFSPTGSPVDNYVGFAQPAMLQNNFGQRYSRNDMFSMSSSMGSMKSGFEMLKVLREAEKKGFTAEDVEIAFNFSADSAMEWLETNWSNMVETVLTLANNQIMQNEKKRGVTKKALLQIPLITETEAKQALRNARGNIWQAIEKCVQRKEQEKQGVNGNTTNTAKTFTLKISELGAGRDNFDENKQRKEESVKAKNNTMKENERLANIEEMLESWKKELIAGKKSKEQFLNTIEDLVKKKIEFIDETLARRKSSTLEEDLRRRFIEEFFSDEELDENIFVREDTINVVDGQGNVVCVKDAYKDAVNELSKEEITKKLRDKGFFIGDEKSTIEQLTGTSASVYNDDKTQLLSADNASTTSKGKKSSASCSQTNEQLFQASKLISEMNATLQQSLQSLHSLNTNESTHVTDGEQSSAQTDTLNIVVNVSQIANNDTEIQELLTPNEIYSDAQQSVGENEDQFENESKHVAINDSTQNSKTEEKNANEATEATVDSNKDVNAIENKSEETISSEDGTHSDASQNVVKEQHETQGSVSTTLTKKLYDCELCAGSFRLAEMVTMPSCDHSACIECLQQYFTVQIREKQKVIIHCPYCNQPEINEDDEDAVCNYLSILDQLLKELLPEDLHELFQRKVRDRTLQKDPSFRWCPQCSSGFLACDPNAKTIACPDCKAVTCSQCKKVWQKQHIGISCEKFAEWMKANDPKFAEKYIDSHLRQFGIDCPQCKFHYELSRGGCIHFHCVQCGHDFCGFCQMPFKMGDKCDRSEWCKKLGFHAHHPRNCLFYLRDRDVNDLKRLLDMHKIKYENMNDKEKSKSKKCQIMEQKWKIGEPQTGMIDTSCGREVYCNGVCKSHYIEYLTEMIRKNKVDPVDILDEDEMVHLLRRADVKIPIKINPKQHIINLRQVIQEELPLC
ncbi:RING finger protein 31-like protein [Leptotrombidium deliense]|uniref:RING finger protein 31-like protein n=1 Tax=Leptotrombidium deliense TaxID=299467 RepID=A0A443SU71_9ACAR|nr:RING finger protein 31-like protein [Leptotrombidium deliense]